MGRDGMGRREYDVPPIIPSMYPIPEYRPSTPQSNTQPEMVDTVKTYTRPFFREPKIRTEEKRRERERCMCVCVCVCMLGRGLDHVGKYNAPE